MLITPTGTPARGQEAVSAHCSRKAAQPTRGYLRVGTATTIIFMVEIEAKILTVVKIRVR